MQVLKAKEIELQDKQAELLELQTFISTHDVDQAYERMEYETVAQAIKDAVPGFYGQYFLNHFQPYLQIKIKSKEQEAAYNTIKEFWDNTEIRIPLLMRISGWLMDCVRDVLICIEENTGLRKYCFFVDSGLADAAKWTNDVTEPPAYQLPLLQKYGNDTLIYHVHYCLDSGLAIRTSDKDEYKIHVADLSPNGHEFLAKIRDKNQWAAVKSGLSAVRNYSLSAISSVAEGITSAAISSYFAGQK